MPEIISSFRRKSASAGAVILVLAVGLSACGSDASPSAPVDETPLVLSVSEVPTSSGGTQARFSWTKGSVYRLSVSRPNTNGTSTIMWSWEVVGPSLAVAGGITYGSTPTGASCSIHKCQATGLSRGVQYNLTVWYDNEKTASLNFSL